MKLSLQLCVCLPLFLIFTACGPAEVRKTKTIDLSLLLNQMLDRSVIAEIPDPAFRCAQASSYNRKSNDPDHPDWYATHDYSQFVRQERNEGRREWVMMDVEGPGAIVRWWVTQYKFDGTIRVYLDGQKTPILKGPADKLLGGAEGGLVGPPLGATKSRGCNLYLPIPFAEHCKITYEGANPNETKKFADNIYYNINYIQYAKGVKVKTFTKRDFEKNAELVQKVQTQLLLPDRNALPVRQTIKGGKSTLAPGKSFTRKIPIGGAICRLRVKVDAGDIAQAMRSTVISIEFDGVQRVWAPVGGFFGTGPGLNPFKGWWRQVEKDGWMTCWWPMPYMTGASITLTNHGRQNVTVELGGVDIADWQWSIKTLYFNASWRGKNNIPVFGENYKKASHWNYAKIKGFGVYVGDTMAVFNRPKKGPKGPWWGEGDEKIYVDGEKFPSHFGTGTEDYFGYAWGTAAAFEAPFHAQPIGGANKSVGHTTNTRTRMLDRIPFLKSLKFDMELMHWQSGTDIDYATTCYWYAMDGAESNGMVSPSKVGSRVGEIDRNDPSYIYPKP